MEEYISFMTKQRKFVMKYYPLFLKPNKKNMGWLNIWIPKN